MHQGDTQPAEYRELRIIKLTGQLERAVGSLCRGLDFALLQMVA